jgi:hypothetical protein
VTIQLHDTMAGAVREFDAAGAWPRPYLQLRPDGLRPGPRRQLPVVPVRRSAGPLPALPRPARDVGHEHHRRGRQDNQGRAGGRSLDRRDLGAVPRRLPGRHQDDGHDHAGRDAPRDRAHSADGRPDRQAARARQRLSDRRRLDLLPDRVLAALRSAGRLDPEGMRVGERVEADEYGKDDVRDFAVWKGPKPDEPSWDTAIGRAGRAGTSSARP